MNKINPLLLIIILIINLISVFFAISLLSFNILDPSWSQSTSDFVVNNLFGKSGAWISDILFSIFGVISFTIPPLLTFLSYTIYKQKKNYGFINFFLLSINLTGIFIFILISCILVSINFDDLLSFFSGGIVGNILSNMLLCFLSPLKITLILLFFLIVSIGLINNLSFLFVIKIICNIILLPIILIINYIKNNKI